MRPGVIKFVDKCIVKRIILREVFFITRILLPVILYLHATHQPACARDYIVNKTVGIYDIQVRLDRYPLVMGDNPLEIEITDNSNTPVQDAKVLVNYYMPPMPRMAPMNYKVKADWGKKSYKAKLDIIMAGPWYIKIIFKNKGKIVTTKFNVDAQ